jgi:hypothetical protein
VGVAVQDYAAVREARHSTEAMELLMRHRSKTNSRPHERLDLRAHYRDQNPTCELSLWFKRHWRNGWNDRELNDQSAEVNHIFSVGSRPDLWGNLITVSGTVHRWFHSNLMEGRILCMHRKMIKNELNLDEIRTASGFRLEGWLLARETENPWLKPLWQELLAFAEKGT